MQLMMASSFLESLGWTLRVGQPGGLRAIGLDDPADGLVVDPGFAIGDLADAFDEQVGRDGARHDAAHAAAVEFDDVGFVGLDDLDDQLGVGRAPDEVRDGIDGAGDELAFEHDDVGRIALQSGMQVGEGLRLCDHADVVFKGEDLLHANAVDCLRICEDDANAYRCCSSSSGSSSLPRVGSKFTTVIVSSP